MLPVSGIGLFAAGLILGKLATELALARLNRRHVLRHADQIPTAFQGTMDRETYRRAVDYTLAKNRFGIVQDVWGAAVLILLLFSGVLACGLELTHQLASRSAWAEAGYLVVVAIATWVAFWPLDWIQQFRLEERFGFNTSTHRLWWIDRLRSTLLLILLAYPLLVLILKCAEWARHGWWIWACGVVIGFQLIMAFLGPVLILPLFNKFSPLPEGPLRDRLMALASRARFRARGIQVMDGSRRSQHSNAFFTGFGRFRRIVLFDTLVKQLEPDEIEAVLAHEVGHYKKGHVLWMLLGSTVGLVGGFALLGWLSGQAGFYQAFQFGTDRIAAALLLYALLAGPVTFWLSPLWNGWSRRFEYQADAFAARLGQGPAALIRALRKLSRENLSNLTPHPVYSWFHYSHPTLAEREARLHS